MRKKSPSWYPASPLRQRRRRQRGREQRRRTTTATTTTTVRILPPTITLLRNEEDACWEPRLLARTGLRCAPPNPRSNRRHRNTSRPVCWNRPFKTIGRSPSPTICRICTPPRLRRHRRLPARNPSRRPRTTTITATKSRRPMWLRSATRPTLRCGSTRKHFPVAICTKRPNII